MLIYTHKMQAILIGFSEGDRPLPGGIVDLYRCYSWLLRIGCKDINVISDHSGDPSVELYRDIVCDANTGVDSNLLSFITDLGSRHHHLLEPTDVNEKINALADGTKRLFLYITGHGKKEGLVCPKGILRWELLRHIMIEKAIEDALILIDTCYGYHMSLPYILARDHPVYKFRDHGHFIRGRIVVLTTEGTVAAGTVAGSFATQQIFKFLEEGIIDYFQLRGKVEGHLTGNPEVAWMNLRLGVYSSQPVLHYIWPWLTPFKRRVWLLDSSDTKSGIIICL